MLMALRISIAVSLLASSFLNVQIGNTPSIMTVAAEESPSTAISLVIQTHANARVRRDGWTAFSQLNLGAEVTFGDLIDPNGEPVHILCANLIEQVVTQIGPVPCPRERNVLVQNRQALVGWQRGKTEDLSIPFLISPRATLIATSQPLIWWNAVPGADGYRVTVQGQGVDWSTTVKGGTTNKIPYPKDAPPLVAGTAYTIEITEIANGTDGHSSTDEDIPGLSFTLMSPDEIANIQKDVANIRTSLSNKIIGDLTVAYYDAQKGLKAEALELLSNISGDLLDPQSHPIIPVGASPIVYLKLGDLFMGSQLNIHARTAYQRALDLSAKTNDLESQAIASVGLARLTSDSQQQRQYAANALKFWTQLGAQDQMNAVHNEFNLDQANSS